MKLITNVNEFGENVLNNKKIILIDFYADWCVPCKLLEPKLSSLEKKYNEEIFIYKINIDNEDCSNICDLYEIKSIPNITFIKDNVKKQMQLEIIQN